MKITLHILQDNIIIDSTKNDPVTTMLLTLLSGFLQLGLSYEKIVQKISVGTKSSLYSSVKNRNFNKKKIQYRV